MSSAKFRIINTGPLVTFQDSGRPGNMRFGVPASGPMDQTSFVSANLAVGNSKDATAIEVSMGGLQLECLSGTTTLAVVGSEFHVDLEGVDQSAGVVLTIKSGQTLTIRPGKSGSWCYLTFSGELDAAQWLGKTATHSQSGFGGGTLKSGMEFTVQKAELKENLEGEIVPFKYRPFDGYARVVLGPQDHHFLPDAISSLMSSDFTLTTGYDRMGMRLDGPPLQMEGSLSIPSEPIIRGSIQVAGDGAPTILLADHQTTGGYPKIATVISSDLDRIVQLRPREKLRFKAISSEDAIKLARIRAIELKYYFETLL